MARWALLQHVAYEGPGLIATEAAAAGIDLVVVRRDLDQPLPALDDVDGLVIMGGPMSAADVVGEWPLAAAAVERGMPLLGVCLGCQVLAAALGARVSAGPSPEIGRGEVTLVVDDPLLGERGERLQVMHWHGDTFDVPQGAVLLASSDAYPHQAFRIGDRAYGLQFHIEVDAALARDWEPRLPAGAEVAPTGQHGRRALRRLVRGLAAVSAPASPDGGAGS